MPASPWMGRPSSLVLFFAALLCSAADAARLRKHIPSGLKVTMVRKSGKCMNEHIFLLYTVPMKVCAQAVMDSCIDSHCFMAWHPGGRCHKVGRCSLGIFFPSHANYYKVEQRGARVSFELQMAKLMAAIYGAEGAQLFVRQEGLASVVGTFRLRHSITWKQIGMSDVLGVYADKVGRCAVVFQGTNNIRNMFTDAHITTKDICGGRLMKGAYNTLMRTVTHSTWKREVAPFLMSSHCKAGVYSLGHSVGGMAATAFAACANNMPRGLDNLARGAGRFRVNGLYTLGAGGAAKSLLTNRQRKDGCFPGIRWYNEDTRRMLSDPVPAFGNPVGLKHPNMMAVRLSQDGPEVRKVEFKCNTRQAFSCPSASDEKCGARGLIQSNLDIRRHFPQIYTARIGYVYKNNHSH